MRIIPTSYGSYRSAVRSTTFTRPTKMMAPTQARQTPPVAGLKPADQQLYQLIVSIVCQAYDCKPEHMLASRTRLHTEAKMFCIKLLREQSNLSLRTLAKVMGLSHGNVSDKITYVNDCLHVGDKYITSQYNRLLDLLKNVSSYLPQESPKEPLQAKESATPAKGNRPKGQGGRFVKKETSGTPSMGGGGSGDGGHKKDDDEPVVNQSEEPTTAEVEMADIPSLEASPLNENVIDRGKPDTSGKTPEAKVQPLIDPEKQKAFLHVDNPDSYTPDFREEEGDADRAADRPIAEQTVDVPPYQFTESAEPGNGGFGSNSYNVPPEASEKATKFSARTLINLVDLMLPKVVSMSVEMDEYAIGEQMAEGGKAFADAAVKRVKKLNADGEHELRSTVNNITPYLEEPLQHYLKFSNLELPPWAALLAIVVWLGAMTYMGARGIAKRNKGVMADLEDMLIRNREANVRAAT